MLISLRGSICIHQGFSWRCSSESNIFKYPEEVEFVCAEIGEVIVRSSEMGDNSETEDNNANDRCDVKI